MNYIVIDLEFNGRKHYDIRPMEIIEIGAVKLNERLETVDTFQSYIRPKFTVNRFALQFCGISKDTLMQSDSFDKVLRRFLEFCGDEFTLLAWGGSDFFHFFVDCKINKLSSTWLSRMLDLTRFFEGGLQQALVQHELEPIGQHHSALDDALNAAQLVRLKPELVESDQYFVPDPFKLCTGGIKKLVSICLDEAIASETQLTWEQFKENEKTKSYIQIMRLNAIEVQMVEALFTQFTKIKYGRKWKKPQPT
ncbi:3'-5' exonuclease [Paenibacillus cremeus]|uniref:Exonuclease domain-containing protein n=1 Tax=Paenibacillus cremeus TaxID=2163881 RepID=A0A559KC59_9BACL|nr:3'-5' exonuclease [Paenibacillus cremeus]TVY09705.1 exonuclease domain-containing protein [Paenibacillus cremeus]